MPIRVTEVLKGRASELLNVDEGYWDNSGDGVALDEHPWTAPKTHVLAFLRYQDALDFSGAVAREGVGPIKVTALQYVGPQGAINLDSLDSSSAATLKLLEQPANAEGAVLQVRKAIANAANNRTAKLVEPSPIQPSGAVDKEVTLWRNSEPTGPSSVVFSVYGNIACLDLLSPSGRAHATCITSVDLERALDSGFQVAVPEASVIVVARRPGPGTAISLAVSR